MAPELDGNVRDFKIDNALKRISEAEEWRRKVDDERSARTVELKDLHNDMDELKSLVGSLRRSLITFSITIAGSSVIFALTTLIATGRLGH